MYKCDILYTVMVIFILPGVLWFYHSSKSDNLNVIFLHKQQFCNKIKPPKVRKNRQKVIYNKKT